ncbi:MAG: addiction module toxin RelE [Mediterranea massiliensis]|nr:addiction module toxin RelE [Mediterranea massiliensis]
MDVIVRVSDEFERQAKRFTKKYKTFVDDFAFFLTAIKENPFQGVDLGGGKRKVRMAVSSKGKGKSGGLRVITFNVQIIESDCIHVNLVTLYDKNEISNVSDKYINQIIKNLK